MHMRVGPPVDLDDLRGRPLTSELLSVATGRLIDRITELLEDIRGEKAPPERLDYKAWRKARETDQSEES